jgi:APA family basic amino acid/polyamine antiporter
MLYSSIAYTGKGALIGLGVLLAGLPIYWLVGRKPSDA